MDKRQAVDRHDFPVREDIPEYFERNFVVCVAISRYQYGAVNDQEIGVGRRQAVTILIVFRCRQR